MITGPDGRPLPQQKQQVNIDVMSQPDIKCTQCGGKYFTPAVMFKKVSKLLTGAPEDQIAPINIFACKDCNTPLEELMPKSHGEK